MTTNHDRSQARADYLASLPLMAAGYDVIDDGKVVLATHRTTGHIHRAEIVTNFADAVEQIVMQLLNDNTRPPHRAMR